MTTIQAAKKYVGQFFVGFNIPGQCVAFINKIIEDVFGLRFPLLGARTARELLKTKNTRPDLFEIVINNPKDPNQLPSPGDFFVKGKGWGGWNKEVNDWNGHTGVIIVVGTSSFTSIEQNNTPNKVTEQVHDYNNLDGWIHIKNNDKGDEMLTRQKIIDTYLVIRGSAPSEAEIAAHLNGGTMESLVNGFKGEANATRANVQKALSDLQTALTNEKNKPPVEVVKTVEKIVEKVVEKVVIKEVEPSWVGKIRDFILKFLKKG